MNTLAISFVGCANSVAMYTQPAAQAKNEAINAYSKCTHTKSKTSIKYKINNYNSNCNCN